MVFEEFGEDVLGWWRGLSSHEWKGGVANISTLRERETQDC